MVGGEVTNDNRAVSSRIKCTYLLGGGGAGFSSEASNNMSSLESAATLPASSAALQREAWVVRSWVDLVLGMVASYWKHGTNWLFMDRQ